MSSRSRLRIKAHYAWLVAGITFLVLLTSAGIRATPSVLIVPLESEFGWSRATISAAISVGLLLYGLIGPFCAALAERIGIRRMILIAMSTVALGVTLATRITQPWHLILAWGLLVGAGTGMTALVLGTVIVNRWFAGRRGLVLGALTSSTATGQLIFLPLLAILVERHGWRAAAFAVAAAAACVIPVVLLFLRERPSDLGLAPYGSSEVSAVPASSGLNPGLRAIRVLATSARSRDFWLLFGTFFICGASTNGLVGTHLIPACMDHGIPEVRAAGLLATMGVFDILGTTCSGWLSDRWDNRKLLAWYYGLRGLSLLFLPQALIDAHAGLSIFAVFYGLDWIATVPPTVRLATNAFGGDDAPIVFGWVVAGHQIGAALAAFGAGFVRTMAGDYRLAFLVSGTLCLLAAGFSLLINRGRARGPAAALPVAT